LIVVLILPFQTAFEELFIRSYIFQAVGYNTGSIIVALAISTLTFGLLHGFNPEVGKYGFWPMMSYYLIAGLIMGLIVVFDRRIELAIGVHTATNAFGALFVTYKGAAIQTDSIFIIAEINPLFYSLIFMIGGVIFILLAGRKYKWNFEISKNHKIDE
jgi:membrane protease YdiL (CAAX protease family)